MDSIRTALEGASAYLTAHPDEAEYTDSAATARLESGLRVTVTGAAGESLVTDMPTSVGGGGSAPSAGWLLRAAEAACVTTLIAMRAAALGVVLREVSVVADSRSDDRGILGLVADIPAGPLSVRIAVRLAADGATASDLEGIVHWAVAHCPVVDAVRRATPITVEIEIG
jgi:uncharacterized OsmC-like protein